MAKHAVTYVMDERCCQCHMELMLTKAVPRMTLDYLHQLTGRVKHANRVRKAGMSGTWKHHLRKTELTYATQTLKRLCLNNLPKCTLKLIRSKLNQVV